MTLASIVRGFPRIAVMLGCLMVVPLGVPPAQSQGTPTNTEPGMVAVFDRSALTIQTEDGRRLPFTVEEAVTPPLQQLGLMYRTALPIDAGMIFVWGDDRPRTMWMKNTLIPLDMLFLDSKGFIIHIAANTTPKSERLITFAQPARAILELNGGASQLLSISVGDRVLHPLLGASQEEMRP